MSVRPTPEQLHGLLDYDAETGALIWKPRSGQNRWNARWAGKNAGVITPNGYVDVCIFAKNYKAHRVIWALVYGSWPTEQIDHINRIRDDNRISNLRQVTAMGNAHNHSIASSNSSGIIGVFFLPRRKKWAAKICVGGRNKFLGHFSNAEDAHAARIAAKLVYHTIDEIQPNTQREVL